MILDLSQNFFIQKGGKNQNSLEICLNYSADMTVGEKKIGGKMDFSTYEDAYYNCKSNKSILTQKWT